MDNRVINIDKQNNANVQSQRGINIEIHGIPEEISDKVLVRTAIGKLNRIDAPCNVEHIQRCHRLPTRNNTVNPTIVKFTNQFYAEKTHENKKKLNKVDPGELTIENNFFINYNLTPVMKNLAFNCRRLKRTGCWPEEDPLNLK